ncbi:uncharacterized protein EV420DRAFT_1588185 [Desarmillaria tabescens]|uniref:SAP domain-containing protein n=1 Tax=Armillaria tabescens TaxID=1929756 RepID=A0AA39J839_ARMTA|nr:uncharacterized protein EV420DRAFT_1588185 [Desarmillaria tabescens]KAK0437444.1 hypothetical protein EV420DRAFT_1588185 [Desarmillaria tabescens]
MCRCVRLTSFVGGLVRVRDCGVMSFVGERCFCSLARCSLDFCSLARFWVWVWRHCTPPIFPFSLQIVSLSTPLTKPRHFAARVNDDATDHGLRLAACLAGSFVGILVLAFFFIRRRRLVQRQRRASTNTLRLIMDSFPLPPNMLPPEQQQRYVFPCPRQDGPNKNWLDENSNFQMEEIDLSLTHKVPWFAELCQHFGLAHTGNKTTLREQLVKFSQAGMEKWKANILTPTRIPHKGVRVVRDGAITKRKLTRRATRIHEVSIPVSNPQRVLLPTSRFEDTRSQAKIDGFIPWAEVLMVKIAKEEERAQNLRNTHLPEPGVNSVHNHSTQKPGMNPFASPDFVQCVASIVEERLAAHQNSSPSSLSSTVSPETPCPSIDFDSTIMGLTASSTEVFSGIVDRPDSPILPPFEPMQMTSPSMLLSPPALPMSELDRNAPVLSDDTAINPIQCLVTFRLTKPFCYASNLESLIRCWDDRNPDWAPSVDYPIVIHGRPDIYKLNKKTGNEWEKLKSNWLDWKVCLLFFLLFIFSPLAFSILLKHIRHSRHLKPSEPSFPTLKDRG